MNVFNTFVASLENAKVDTRDRTFMLYNNEDQPIVHLSLNHINEMTNYYLVDKCPNIKQDTAKVIKLTPESFIHEVNVRTGYYNYTTREHVNAIVTKVGSKIPIVTSFDTSEWNDIFTTKFDSSWTNVCKYVYYNKSQLKLKYGLKNRTFRHDGNRCVPTKDGVLFSLSNETKFDMNESSTICGIPITWIVLNWMKVDKTTNKKSVINPALKNLFMRLYNMKKYYTNSGISFYSQYDTDTMQKYIVFKSYAISCERKLLDNDQIQKLLDNPNLWYAPRLGYTLTRVPLLTNKDAE